jgi:tRNA nucleotidyltransferase/poly(A) polymerase
MQNLRESILSEPLVEKVLNAGREVFLVGGYLRDLLRGVRSRDIDFVVRGDVKRVLSEVLRDLDGTVVEFREFLMVRAVVQDYTLDFTELKGALEDDLFRRDFSINAIAWSAEKGIIDPLKAIRDIEKGVIRAVCEKNFVDDPLRLLRAYRFSGELGWRIDRKTRKMIRKLKDSIKQSAPERITLEIIKLLNSDGHLRALKQAHRDGLLGTLLSIDRDRLEANIKVLSRFNSFLKKLPEEWRVRLDKTVTQGLSFGGLLRAEQLLYGSDLERNRLSLSRAIIKRLEGTSTLLSIYEENRNIDDVLIFDLFTKAGDAVMDLALLTRSQRILKKAEHFLRISPVLSTAKIMDITGIAPGPELGRVLHEIKKLQFLGKVKDEKDARKWLHDRSN